MRKVDVLTVRGTPRRLGSLIEPDGGEPYGTTDAVDQMLRADRCLKFEQYYDGWSNGRIQTRAVT